VSVVFFISLLVYLTGSFVLTTDSLLCDMLVTFGSFVCYIMLCGLTAQVDSSASEVTTLWRYTNLFIIIIIIIIIGLVWSEGWRPPGAQSTFIK